MRGMTDTANLPPAASNLARDNAAASPPSLHVVTTGSDSGYHGYGGGAHAMHARRGGGRGTSAGQVTARPMLCPHSEESPRRH